MARRDEYFAGSFPLESSAFHASRRAGSSTWARFAPSATTQQAGQTQPNQNWRTYGGEITNTRYSPLSQITPANVGQLEPAWTYRTGDLRGRPGDPEETTFEVTPLKVGNRLYLCTPHQSVVALDATTGKQVWRRDLQMRPSLALQHLTCRGLSYFRAEAAAASPCEPYARPFTNST